MTSSAQEKTNRPSPGLRRSHAKKIIRDNVPGILYALPIIVSLAVFTIYPVIQSLVYSFTNYDGFFRMDNVGFANFARIFSDSFEGRKMLKIFGNTFLYAGISVPLGLVGSYFLALLLRKPFKGLSLFKVLIYLPCVIPGVASAIVWADIFQPDYGIMNQIFQGIGLPRSQFFLDASTAMPSLIAMGIWTFGGGMILWLAAFGNIPEEMYEAAKIDGASAVKSTLHVTIPLSTQMIFYNLIVNVIGSLQTFNTLVLAGGAGEGPKDSLYMIAVKIYNEAFQSFNMGYASAIAWVLFLIIAGLTAIVFATSKWVFYGEES